MTEPGEFTHEGGARDAAEARRERRMRRRFARRAWARRWGFWKPALGIVCTLVVLGLGAWVVWWSDVLAVDEVRVTGTSYLDEEAVLAAARVPNGQPLVRLDVDRVESRVEALAPVRAVEVRRELPGTVVIAVSEREAVAVLEIGSEVMGIDAEGVVFREFRRPPKRLPRVRDLAGGDEESRKEAATVVTSLPADLAKEVRRVDVETIDQITLVLSGDRTVVWGSGENSAQKAAVLAALVQASADAKTYDVSVPGQPSHSG